MLKQHGNTLMREKVAGIVAILGLLLTIAVILILACMGRETDEIASLAGIPATLAGTLAGLFLGHQVGEDQRKAIKEELVRTQQELTTVKAAARQSRG